MRLNILIGGKAGQGINKVSGIVSKILINQGYFTFNYRDYPSIIRGGHNFNVLSISDKNISSHESKIDILIALDELTKQIHKDEIKKNGIIIDYKDFLKFGLNLNIALSGTLTKVLGIPLKILLAEVKRSLPSDNKQAIIAATTGYNSQSKEYNLKKINNHLAIMSGSQAVAIGAINSNIDLYFAYPMTPATGVLHELAAKQLEHHLMTFQPEGEIAAVNMALGASFSGAKVMVGTSGGGFDLMSEGLSLQGISEIPLVVYLASRVGPGTGIPTYNMQGDLDIALRAGHGEFPRIVASPGDPLESIEITNELMYLSEKFRCLSILLSDKHVAESEFSTDKKHKRPLKINITRKLPGEFIVKSSSYEQDDYGLTTEAAEFAIKNGDARIEKYEQIRNECKNFEMIKIHGKKDSKNLIIGWGSTKGAIMDAIQGEDFKFLQAIYLKPMSDKIKNEILKAKNVILVESNLTGQLGRLIREKTGISIKNRILKYDGRPFRSDELKKQLLKI
jgi:2-oxoglutarate ferredoxin oxidoreductase subunit alpha